MPAIINATLHKIEQIPSLFVMNMLMKESDTADKDEWKKEVGFWWVQFVIYSFVDEIRWLNYCKQEECDCARFALGSK
jgi:hypothetical protein